LATSNKFISYLLLFSKEIPKYLPIDVEMVVKKVAANNNINAVIFLHLRLI
jgi:hypothetical protein